MSILTNDEVSKTHRFLGKSSAKLNEGEYLFELLYAAAAKGCEPSISQRIDKRWQVSLHDPKDMDHDAYTAIGDAVLLAFVRAILLLPEEAPLP
jgi:hypothetical protein